MKSKALVIIMLLNLCACAKENNCMCEGENSFEIHHETDYDACYRLSNYSVYC